jgi:hypothetical protein
MKSLCRKHFFRLASLWHSAHLLETGAHFDRDHERRVMLFDPKQEQYLGRLEAQLRRAQALTQELISDVLAEACIRFATRGSAAKFRIDRLIESGAWTDAALALVELELPHWKLRRMLYEDGEWHCYLSKQPQLPIGFDEVAEGSHEILALAILIALLQARRDAAVSTAGVTAVPRIGPVAGYAMCCDNFS